MTITIKKGKPPTRPLYNENGITIRELKDFLKQFSDIDINGEPTEVWVSTDEGRSSPVKSLWNLNNTDILLDTNT